MAMSAVRSVWSVTVAAPSAALATVAHLSPSSASTTDVFDAFATTRNRSAACRYTTRSSRMPPSRQRVVERRAGPRPGHRDLAHVRQVEQAGRRADRAVLGGLAAVAQRHQPAGEIGHRRAQPLVHGAQRGAAGGTDVTAWGRPPGR